MQFIILGNGAIGHALHNQVCPSKLLARGEKIERTAEQAIFFVVTKAYDLEAAVEQSIERMQLGDICALGSNGHHVALRDKFRSKYPHIHWQLGVVSFGARWVDQRLEISGLHDGCIAVEFAHENQIFRKAQNIELLSLKKWLFNTSLNTLCAAYSLPRNALVDRSLLHSVFLEAYELGTHLFRGFDAPAESLWSELLTIVERTGDNENSMAIDKRLRRRTEAQFFAGRAFGLDGYPLLKTLYFACGDT